MLREYAEKLLKLCQQSTDIYEVEKTLIELERVFQDRLADEIADTIKEEVDDAYQNGVEDTKQKIRDEKEDALYDLRAEYEEKYHLIPRKDRGDNIKKLKYLLKQLETAERDEEIESLLSVL